MTGGGRAGAGPARDADAPLAHVRAVVLDLDGTLLDHVTAARAAAAAFLRARGVTATDDELGDAWIDVENRHYPRFERGEISHVEQRRERLRDLLPRFALPVPESEDELDATFAEYLDGYAAAWTAFPEALACVEALAGAGLPVVILTNGVTEQQVDKVRAIGLGHLAEHVMATDRLPAAKPSPQAYAAVQERLGLRAPDLVMVGDNLRNDVVAPRQAGWEAVWVAPTAVDESGLPAGAHRVRSLAELAPLLGVTSP